MSTVSIRQSDRKHLLSKLSLSYVPAANSMDRQTDGQTDERLTIAIPRLHYVHRAVKSVHVCQRYHKRLRGCFLTHGVYCVSIKRAHHFFFVCNFDTCQPILLIFG